MQNNDANVLRERNAPILEELRELGSAEFNAMSFTPPRGSAMTLDEYASHKQTENAEREASLKAMQRVNADEKRRRHDMKDMTNEQRAAYLEAENKSTAEHDLMRDIPDLARPILYQDEETGEIIPGGEDSPRADVLRAKLGEKRKKRLAARYAEAPETQETSSAATLSTQVEIHRSEN